MSAEKDDMTKSGIEAAQGSDVPDNVETVGSTPYIDPAKEKAIVRKFDLWVMPQFVVILVLAYVYSNLASDSSL